MSYKKPSKPPPRVARRPNNRSLEEHNPPAQNANILVDVDVLPPPAWAIELAGALARYQARVNIPHKAMTQRVALYARYSSDLQSAKSVEDQLALCRRHLEANSWIETKLYADFAVSGGAMVTRPGIQELIRGATCGEFDIVLAEALDRLSRDQADTATIYKILAFHNVKIVTLSEGEVDTMHIGFKGVMNEMFLRDLAKKTRRGQAG